MRPTSVCAAGCSPRRSWVRGPTWWACKRLPGGAAAPSSSAKSVCPTRRRTEYDFLQMLLDRLSAKGVPYTAVHVQTESDVEAPSWLGNPLDRTGSDMSDVRLTMRDVILMRVDDDLEVLDAAGAHYDARLDFPIAGATYSFIRGYNYADVLVGSRPVRFINTHLEAFSSDLAFAQAQQLMAGPADHDGTTIIACDCNSDPLNDSVKSGDTVPHKAAYELITGASGFTDQWLQKKKAHTGWTSGLSERLDDETAAGFDHRIDMIFAREAAGCAMKTKQAEVTGNQLRDRDRRTGLWPSDHAGVVITLH